MKTILTVIAVLCCVTLFSQAGSLDSSFGSGGKFIYSANNYPYYFTSAYAMSIQKDGKIILAGVGTNYYGNGTQDFAVLRLNANGTVDNTFGANGLAFVDFSYNGYYSADIASSINIQADGKIVVAGESDAYNYIDSTNTYSYSDIAVARLNTDGSLDTTFYGTGKEKIDLSRFSNGGSNFTTNYDHCYAVTVKANGKILLGGTSYTHDATNGDNYDAVVLQLNADGSFDPTFSNSGILYIKKPGHDDNISGLAIQNDGKIIGAGNTFNTTSLNDLLATRLKPNGAFDNTFGSNGIASIDLNNNSYDFGTSLVLQANGKILLGGYTNSTNGSGLVVVKLNSNGSFDNSFNGTGKTFYYSNDIVGQRQIAVQKDGRIIQSYTQYSYTSTDANYLGGDNFAVIRYNANGGIDSSFGTLGKSVIDFGNYTSNIYQDDNSACAVQSDGKIVAAGTVFSNSFPCAVRLKPNGKNYGLSGPADQSDTAANGNCSITFNNIDPVLYPDTSLSIVKYVLYNNSNYNSIPYDSGYGSVSGKPFNIGNTTVVYTSTIDPLQRAVFNVNVGGGTPAGALDFDGTNDRVDISYLNPINSYTYGQYSFEGWIKVRGYNPNGSVIFGDERNNNGGILVQLDSKGYISTYQPSVGNVVSKYKVTLNKWTHIAFVQSSAKLDLYVNGKYVQTLLTAPYLHTATYSNFYLGAYTTDNNTFSRNFNGEMDEVRVWGNAICQGQIQNNLHCEIPDYPTGLVAYFKFNQGLASCNNLMVTNADGRYTSGVLQNFALNGPTSNWVAGHISGSCAVFTPLAITSYPNSINVSATNDSCSATVNFAIGVSTGCSDSAHITYSQNPGTSFPIGTTYEYVTVQDDFGNSQSISFPITVTESTPPTLVLKDTGIALSQYGYVYINPYDLIDTLYDNCTPQYDIGLYSSNNYFYCYNTGANSVTLTAYDQSGNSTTKTATVTILPYVGSASITATPNPQQYSDVATLQATLYEAQNFYYNGCLSAPTVTFKVGSKVLGTVTTYPDYNGNLIAVLNYQLTDIFPKKITATFNGLNTGAYSLVNATVSTTLNGTPENATVDYIESQLINTSTNKVTIPVAAQIIDTADGSRGDIRKSIVTFTIQPVTPGATVVGSNTLTVSALEFLNADHTSGIARGNFTVKTGGSANSRFNVIVTVSNYYTGTTTALVYVSKSGGNLIASDSKTALSADGKPALGDNNFGVLVSPNPSSNQFTLQVTSSDKLSKVNIRISDVSGKILETFSNVSAGQIVQLGAKYSSGVYIAEISQGTNKRSYKLIKL